MKKRRVLWLWAALVLGMAFLPSAFSQEIKTIDGVPVVLNGRKPTPVKDGPSRVTLVEELTVGKGDSPDESFLEVNLFAVDDKGRIYALDSKDRKVKAFDEGGKFLGAFGKPGQGPGEFGLPSGIQVSPSGELVVEDATNRRLAWFSLDGRFLRNVSTAGRLALVSLLLDGKGGIVGREMGLSGNEMFFEIKKFDSDLKPLFSIDKIPFAIPLPGAKLDIMSLTAAYQVDAGGRIYYGRNIEYEINVYEPQGKHSRSIRKEYDPVKITQEDIDRIMSEIPSTVVGGVNVKDMFEFSKKIFPPFQSFILDDRGRLYVRTWEKGPARDEYLVDVFDPEGRFILRFPTKADLRVWKMDKVFGIEEDAEGFKVIKRYKAVWE